MTDAVMVAIITASASVAAQIFISLRSNSLMGYRIGELEKKVDRHNRFMERVAVLERDNKTTFRMIDELKKGGAR